MIKIIKSLGAWKCNFSPFKETMTDRPTNRPTDMKDHGEVTFPRTL